MEPGRVFQNFMRSNTTSTIWDDTETRVNTTTPLLLNHRQPTSPTRREEETILNLNPTRTPLLIFKHPKMPASEALKVVFFALMNIFSVVLIVSVRLSLLAKHTWSVLIFVSLVCYSAG